MTLAAEIAADAPVAWWRLDETSGTAAADSAGANTGTYTGGPTLNQTGLAPSDSPNRAVLFTAASLQYVQVPHAAALNAASLTVQASFDASSISGNPRIVEKGNSDSGWSLRIEGTNLRWYVNGRVTVDYYFADLGRHIAHGTYDAATGTGRLYLDGALVASATGTPGSAPTPADPLRIAQKPGGSATGDGWNGLLDDVAVYPTVLSAARIAAHAAAVGLTGYPTTFDWKGYTWVRAARAPAAPFVNAFAGDHVTLDGSGYLHLAITNSGGASVGAELSSTTQGLGYGTYTVIVGSRVDDLHPNVVFGGLFLYGTDAAYGHREIDCCEQSKWSAPAEPCKLGHVTWMPSTPDPYAPRGGYDAAGIPTLSDAVQCTVMVWEPTRVTFRTYHGATPDPAQLFRESVIHEGDEVTFSIEGGGSYTGPATIPRPGDERAHLNLWVAPNWAGSDPATVTATDIVIHDFTYAPPATAPSTAAALRDLIDALGIGAPRPWSVALGKVRPGEKVPYIVVSPGISTTREPGGDYGDPAADDGATELVQVDVVQRNRDAQWTPEDPYVVDRIVAAVTGCRLPSAPHRVYGVTCDQAVRLDDPGKPNFTRTAITVRVRRSLRRSAV